MTAERIVVIDTPVIYLDHSTSTDLRPNVLGAMRTAAELGGNPSSLHALGRRARRLLEDASDAIRALVGSERGEVIFTSGAAEANLLAAWGLGRTQRRTRGAARVVLQATPPLAPAGQRLRDDGFAVTETAQLSGLPQGDDLAVSAVVWADAATGALQPVADWAPWTDGQGGLLHVDASQAVAWLPAHFDALGVASMALCGHKLGGPRGIGALVVRKGQGLDALWGGGSQNDGKRPGTEALALACGLGEAARHAAATMMQNDRIRQLRGGFEASLRAVSGSRFQVIEGMGERLNTTVLVRVPSLSAAQAVAELGARGVMAGVADAQTVCFSLGWSTTSDDTDSAVLAVQELIGNGREAL